MGLWAVGSLILVGLSQISEGLPHKLSLNLFLRESSNQVVTEGNCGSISKINPSCKFHLLPFSLRIDC